VYSYRQIPRSGIQHSLILEWFLAARWAGVDWFGEFDGLDGDDAAFIVAAYRTQLQEEAVIAWDLERKRKRRS
jgi:hypothetical protein